jgi:hypothetical protein
MTRYPKELRRYHIYYIIMVGKYIQMKGHLMSYGTPVSSELSVMGLWPHFRMKREPAILLITTVHLIYT